MCMARRREYRTFSSTSGVGLMGSVGTMGATILSKSMRNCGGFIVSLIVTMGAKRMAPCSRYRPSSRSLSASWIATFPPIDSPRTKTGRRP